LTSHTCTRACARACAHARTRTRKCKNAPGDTANLFQDHVEYRRLARRLATNNSDLGRVDLNALRTELASNAKDGCELYETMYQVDYVFRAFELLSIAHDFFDPKILDRDNKTEEIQEKATEQEKKKSKSKNMKTSRTQKTLTCTKDSMTHIPGLNYTKHLLVWVPTSGVQWMTSHR